MISESPSFRLVNISCLPSSTLYNALVELEVDVSPLMPFLNAAIVGGHYSHEAKVFDFMHEGHIITVLPRQLKVTGVEDEAHASAVIAELRSLINKIWARRDALDPVYVCRKRLSPVEVLRLLPRTNCGECGIPSCLSFAVALIRGQARPADCPPLCHEELADRRSQLEVLSGSQRPPSDQERGPRSAAGGS